LFISISRRKKTEDRSQEPEDRIQKIGDREKGPNRSFELRVVSARPEGRVPGYLGCFPRLPAS
jgi:hypothetical protein